MVTQEAIDKQNRTNLIAFAIGGILGVLISPWIALRLLKKIGI